MAKKKLSATTVDRIRMAAEKCYFRTRGMVTYSTDESDAYWEFAEHVMQLIAKGRREKLPREDEEG
jgi:hypothetical protein